MIVFILLIFIVIVIRKLYGKKIETNPIFFVPFIFLLQFGIPIIIYFFYGNINYTQESLAVLCLFPLSFIFGNFLVLLNIKEYPNSKSITFKYKSIRNLIIVSMCLSIINIFFTLKSTLEFANLDFSVGSILLSAGINSNARYTTNEGRITQGITFYLSVFHYISAILAGILVNLYFEKRSIKLLVFLAIIIGVIASTLEGAKMIFLIILILFGGSSLLTSLFISKDRNSWFSFEYLIKIFSLGLILIMLFFSIQAFRYYDNRVDVEIDYNNIGDIVLVSAIGHLAAFSEWYNKMMFDNLPNIQIGKYTFSGLVSLWGVERLPGLYGADDVYVLNSQTNIYTIYRAIIQEFKYFSFLLFFLLGIVSQWIYLRMLKEFGLGKFTIILALYTFFIWGHIASIFNYNTFLLTFIIFVLLGKLYFQRNYRIKI